MTDDTREPMLDETRLNAALDILGREPDPAPATRVEALGSLLMLAELSAMADVDRLEQESLRIGAVSVAYSLATSNFGLSGDKATDLTTSLLMRTLVDRLDRTRLDLATFAEGDPHAAQWSASPAIDALLETVLTLLNVKDSAAASPAEAAARHQGELAAAARSARRAAELIEEGIVA